ncbi:DUF397 domain-containing protein [Nocardia sp. NEAU-G5]|uniref:DUF397 domain-containing protein n=1 Tax=Nocardia albiluteola TaxID=2842303 RepID=A0ABS6B437_9NOCA|nr:DUF397 domain-containing protein [Nocardia albiluteola]MBU3065073.1 DUF397 domain-containing protein [Nocardia albiluteola]
MNIDLSSAAWYKSSRSASQDTCVEVAHLGEGLVGVRDSKDPSGPALVFEPVAWDAFTAGIQDRKFDLP